MKRLLKSILILSAFGVSTAALAHDGHGTGVSHELHHLLYAVLPLVVLAIAAGVYLVNRKQD